MTAEYTRSLHAFVINILSVQTCLQEFFKQVGAASIPSNIGDMAKELLKYVPHKTCMPIEAHAQSVLTPYAFNSFQNELVMSLQCTVTQLESGSYLVRHYKKLERECLVIWIPEDEQIHCTCKGFENSGTLCRHSLRVLATHNYFHAPDKYLPFRWRLDSSMISVDQQNMHRTNEECYQALHSLADAALLAESLNSKERFNYIHGELMLLLDRVRNIPAVGEVLTN